MGGSQSHKQLHSLCVRCPGLLPKDVDALYTKYRYSLKPGEKVCYFDDFCDAVGTDGYSSFSRYIFDRMRKGSEKGISAPAFIEGVYHFCSVTKEGLPQFLFQIFCAGKDRIDFDGITKMIRRMYDSKHAFEKSGKKILQSVRKNYGGALTKDSFGRFAMTYTSFMFPVFQLHRSMRQRVLGKRAWRRIQRARATGKVAALPSPTRDGPFDPKPPIAPPPPKESERPSHQLTLFGKRFERIVREKKAPSAPPFPPSSATSNTARVDRSENKSLDAQFSTTRRSASEASIDRRNKKSFDARFTTSRRRMTRTCAQCASQSVEGAVDPSSKEWYCRRCWKEYERICVESEDGRAGTIVGMIEQREEEDANSATPPAVVVGVAVDKNRPASMGAPSRTASQREEMTMAEYPLDTTGDGDVDMIGFDSNGDGRLDLVGIMDPSRSKIERVVPVASLESTKQAAIHRALAAVFDSNNHPRRCCLGSVVSERVLNEEHADDASSSSSTTTTTSSDGDEGKTLCTECGESRAIFDGAEDENGAWYCRRCWDRFDGGAKAALGPSEAPAKFI